MAPSPRTLSFLCSGINLTISLCSLACLTGTLVSSTIISALLPQFVYDMFSILLEVSRTVPAIYILLSLLSVGFSLLQFYATHTDRVDLLVVCLIYHLVSFVVDGLAGLLVCLWTGPLLLPLNFIDAVTTGIAAYVTRMYCQELRER